MKFISKMIAVAALALFGAVAPAHAQTHWTPFQPADGGFRIDFPGTPKVVRDTLPSAAGPAPHLSASYTSNGFSYVVELTTFASASPPKAVLDLYANGIGKTNKVRTQTTLKIGTLPARRFDVELTKGKLIGSMLFVTDGTRVYQVLCVSLRGHENSVYVKHFIGSFALTH